MLIWRIWEIHIFNIANNYVVSVIRVLPEENLNPVVVLTNASKEYCVSFRKDAGAPFSSEDFRFVTHENIETWLLMSAVLEKEAVIFDRTCRFVHYVGGRVLMQ